MKNALIFGCGDIGTRTYFTLKDAYNVIGWVDNKKELWGTEKFEIPVLSPEKIKDLINEKNAELFVAVVKSESIVKQLKSYGLNDFYVWREGSFYFKVDSGIQVNCLTRKQVKIDASKRNVLFVMNNVLGGIREYRLGKILKSAGYTIYLAYMLPITEKLDKGFVDIYEEMIQVLSLDDLLSLANDYPFEFIHSSSEPEWGTALLLNSNKPVFHECHDLGSSNVYMTPEQMAVEYLANVYSKGAIYPSEKLRDDAVSKFGIPVENTLVIENTISEVLIPKEKKEKLSVSDNEIHAVYEGAISRGDIYDKRYFEELWKKIAEAGIHIHFYTNHDEAYCHHLESLNPNIHYEGNKSSAELAVEMSKYDVGLLTFNVNERNRLYLENASPNKMYEYINAGIPVATNGIETYKTFVEENRVGAELDFEKDLYKQFEVIKEYVIPKDFLRNKKLTLESKKEEILHFFERK